MRVAALSDKGMARAANQDSIFTSIKPVGCLPNLYIVADGMGGEKAGGYASNSAIEYLLAYMTQNSTGNVNTKKKISRQRYSQMQYATPTCLFIRRL